MNSSENEIKAFFKQWEIYQKIIKFNYMVHNEIFDFLTAFLDNNLDNNKDKPIKILDLGCGDAHVISKAIAGKNIKEYCGVDLSEIALSYAKKNLQVEGDKKFIEKELLEAMKNLYKKEKKYDYIIAGYSLHHLTTEKKDEFFNLAKQMLSQNGYLLIYDILLKDDEDRDEFLKRLFGIFKEKWTNINDRELDLAFEHVENNDFPENKKFFMDMAKKYAFSDWKLTFQDKDQVYGFFCFKN